MENLSGIAINSETRTFPNYLCVGLYNASIGSHYHPLLPRVIYHDFIFKYNYNCKILPSLTNIVPTMEVVIVE